MFEIFEELMYGRVFKIFEKYNIFGAWLLIPEPWLLIPEDTALAKRSLAH